MRPRGLVPASATRRRPAMPQVPTPDELRWIDAWWRAANYLTVGQI